MIVVQKPDSSLMSLDLKELNTGLVRKQCQVPTMEDITPKFLNKKMYSVVDFKDGYYHIKFDEKCTKCIVFKVK